MNVKRFVGEEEFKIRFFEIHGDKYEVISSDFKNLNSFVLVKCFTHGDFCRKARDVLGDVCCIGCWNDYLSVLRAEYLNKSLGFKVAEKVSGCLFEFGNIQLNGLESLGLNSLFSTVKNECSARLSLVYLIKIFINGESFFKIGICKRGINNRMKTIPNDNYDVIGILYPKADAMFSEGLEKMIHKNMKKYSYVPSSDFSGWTECYKEIPIEVDLAFKTARFDEMKALFLN